VRDSDSPSTLSSVSSTSSPPSLPDGRRMISGSRRVAQAISSSNSANSTPSSDSNTFPLPMHSAELARLPLHGHTNFTNLPPGAGGPTDTDVGPLNVNSPDEFWFSALMNSTAAMQEQPNMPHVHNSLVPALGISPNSAQQYPVDPAFFEQMGSGFPTYLAIPNSGPAPQSLPRQSLQPQGVGPPPILTDDTIAMWSNAPTGFELEDWGTYMSELSHGQHQAMPQQGY